MSQDSLTSTTSYAQVATNLTYDNCSPWWPNYTYYPYVYSFYPSPDKGRQAFQIAKALADKKIVTPKTVKDFIDLVEVILKELG